MITGEEAKAARKLLGWSQMTLAVEADVALQTLAYFETGKRLTKNTTVARLERTLERAGVVIREGEPIRLAQRQR
jgi:transcriptional regulator with XRE-family HTH domain